MQENNNLVEFQNRFRSFQNITRNILKPILKNPKFNFFYTISNNWINVVGSKYLDYCCVKKVSLDKDGRQGNIYIVSYNSATSFYLNNNKQYIIERINTLFGYNAVLNVYIKEIPTIVRKKNIKKNAINKEVNLCVNVENEGLKRALMELGGSL